MGYRHRGYQRVVWGYIRDREREREYGSGDSSPKMANQVEKKIEHAKETGGIQDRSAGKPKTHQYCFVVWQRHPVSYLYQESRSTTILRVQASTLHILLVVHDEKD